MKFMKIGTKPDTFYTEEATRTVISDIPSDLTIRINNVCFLLHKIPLVPKCGLLQRLCSDADDSDIVTIDLHDVPGGEDAFELCAKFCYGITINLGAHNFVPAFCAAKFLRMTESIEKGNFVLKLEAFFNSCILEGWKDSIVALQTTIKLPEWSENLGIIRRCIDSIVEKILTPTSKVSWSYTYTRPGYIKKQHQSVPKDWWTEDVSDLDIDLFRCIITAVRSTYIPPPQLIGEALHVYACRWLPDTTKSRPLHSSGSQTEESREKSRRILESIVSMIPSDRGSVSIGFLLKLLSIANYLGASPVTKTELIRKAGLQFEEATLNDMLFPSQLPTDQHFYDIDLVAAVLESYLVLWRRQSPLPTENSHMVRSIRKIGKLIDSYLQVVARDVNMPISKLVSLAEALPDVAREDHDGLYKAINIYLKEHPDVSKADKKRMCRMLDCQKLSPEVRAHAVKNERLPLRTVVQVLFFDQESGSRSTTHKPESITKARQAPIEAEAKEECDKKVQHEGTKSSSRVTETSEREIQKRMEAKMVRGDSEKGKERKGGSKHIPVVVCAHSRTKAMAGITTSFPFKTIPTRPTKTIPLLLSSLQSKLFGIHVRNPNSFSSPLHCSATINARYGADSRFSPPGRSKKNDEDQALDLSSIRSDSVRLIDEEQSMIGIVSKSQAIQMAEDAGLDLVILSPDADPPVVRIMDYNKYRYEQQKKKKVQQKKTNRMDLKELKMGYNIDQHDYSVRLKAARKFLNDGDKVKIIVNLKGRENEFRNMAMELIRRFQNDVGELATEESKNFKDRNIFIVLVPNKAVVQKAQQDPGKKKDKPTKNEVSAGV